VISFVKRYWNKIFPVLVVLFVVAITFVMVYNVIYNRPFFKSRLIAFDTHRISRTLKEIDEYCNILSVRSSRNSIDFLTVKEFVGSEVGCLNLAYPKQWKGAYFRDNPSIRGRVYEIVKAEEGFYVLPGQGVELPNGLEMGKDVIITPETKVEPLLDKDELLNYQGIALGKRLDFVIGDWGLPADSKESLEEINESLIEIKDALPYAEGDHSSSDNA